MCTSWFLKNVSYVDAVSSWYSNQCLLLKQFNGVAIFLFFARNYIKNFIKAVFFNHPFFLSFCMYHEYLYVVIVITCHCQFCKYGSLLAIVLSKFSPLEFTYNGRGNGNNLQRGQMAILRCVKQVVLPAALPSSLVFVACIIIPGNQFQRGSRCRYLEDSVEHLEEGKKNSRTLFYLQELERILEATLGQGNPFIASNATFFCL